MKRRLRRGLCLLLALLMLCTFPAPSSADDESVCFTALNNTLLELNDATMPFWSSGSLYIPSTALDREQRELGIFYNRASDQNTIVLYRGRTALFCDLSSRTYSDNNENAVRGNPPVTRGGILFFPLDLLCQYFDLSFTYTKTTHGYLARITSSDAQALSDSMFLDAATAPMEQRYSRYMQAKIPQPAPEPVPEPSGTVEGGSSAPPPTVPTPSAPPDEEPVPELETERSVYVALSIQNEASGSALLDACEGVPVASLFTQEALVRSGGLLRRLASEGQTIALRVDTSGGPQDTLERIASANHVLWAAANVKTRFVRLDNASEETRRAVQNAGYCPMLFSLILDGASGLAQNAVTRMISAADAGGGSCHVFLDADMLSAQELEQLFSELQESHCTLLRYTELLFR